MPWQTTKARRAKQSGQVPTATPREAQSEEFHAEGTTTNETIAVDFPEETGYPERELGPSGCWIGCKNMAGIATIVWLPQGRISGHFITTNRTCHGLYGRVLPQAADCNRCEDTEVCYVAVQDLSDGQDVWSVLLKTGGDAAVLHTTDDYSLLEGSGVPDHIKNLPRVQVTFVCHTLQTSTAAARYLKKYQPALASIQDAMLTRGEMQLNCLCQK